MDFEKIKQLSPDELKAIPIEELTTSVFIQNYLKENGTTKEVVDRKVHRIKYTYSGTHDELGGEFVRLVDAREGRHPGNITHYTAPGTLLHFAACEEEPLLVRYLLVVCKANCRSVFGGAKRYPPIFTPLRVAAVNDNPQTMEILQEWYLL